MQRERTPQEQAAFEAGQEAGEQIADVLGKMAREVYRKAFPNVPFPGRTIESTAIILDDAPALPAPEKEKNRGDE